MLTKSLFKIPEFQVPKCEYFKTAANDINTVASSGKKKCYGNLCQKNITWTSKYRHS